jgi:CRISPR/Cas system-associated protein Cas7 (RAMP superfamily)
MLCKNRNLETRSRVYATIEEVMDLTEIGWDGIDWIDLAQDRDRWRALVKTVMNLRVPDRKSVV